MDCPFCGKTVKPGEEMCPVCGKILPPVHSQPVVNEVKGTVSEKSDDVVAEGTVLQNRYEIKGLIHAGGMGYVYAGFDTRLKRWVAIKQAKEKIKSGPHLEKLEKEALSMARLSHPNVATVFDHFTQGDHYFLVVEYVTGKSLSDMFDENSQNFTEAQVIKWMLPVCDAAVYIHAQGLIHRDISPDNIMLTEEGNMELIDFGTMRELDASGSRKAGKEGKFGFTAPEQWKGGPAPQSDIFSIGATIYYLLTGYLPISDECKVGGKPLESDYCPEFPPIRTHNPEISSKLESLLVQVLQVDVEKRLQSAAALSIALKSIIEGATSTIPTTAFQEVKVGGSKSKIWGIVLLAIGIIPAIIACIGMARSTGQARSNSFNISLLWELILVLPFIIPGILLLRRGIVPKQFTQSTKGFLSNYWWALSVVFGFIGGIICWIKERNLDRRKAMNILTLGLIMTFSVPIIEGLIITASYKTPPAILQIQSNAVDFNDVEVGLSEAINTTRTITNSGGQALTGKLTTTKNWLWVYPETINIPPGGKQDISIRANTVGMSNGFSDTGYLNISSNGGETQIPIQLETFKPGTLLFTSDLTDRKSGWNPNTSEDIDGTYEDGAYGILLKKPQMTYTLANTSIDQFDDFSAEIDIKKLSTGLGESGGISFRIITDKDPTKWSYYLFMIKNDGTYALGKKDVGNSSYIYIIGWTNSNHIKAGSDINRLKIICKGKMIELFANGYKLNTLQDSSIAKGYLGLAISSGASADAHYHFSNLRVYANK